MNDDSRFPSLPAAISSGIATIATGVASVTIDGYAKILGGAAGLMAAGFLYFVRKWMGDREEADERLTRTIREHTEHQRIFEERVGRFMTLVTAAMGLHGLDSDPEMLISEALKRRGMDRRVAGERRVEAEQPKKGNGDE